MHLDTVLSGVNKKHGQERDFLRRHALWWWHPPPQVKRGRLIGKLDVAALIRVRQFPAATPSR
jgi:hypothetical protein